MTQQPNKRARAKLRTRNQWQQIFADQEASGLNQQAYCQQHNIVLSTFYTWRKKLNKTDKPCPADDFIKIPSVSASQPTVSTNKNWDIELDLGDGVVLRMSKFT